jgi:adenylate cyclase
VRRLIGRLFVRSPGLALGLVAAHAVALWAVVWPDAAGNLELSSYDLRVAQGMALVGEPSTEERILIVDIDERSLDKLGRFGSWPREYHARLLDALSEGDPSVVAFDIIFNDEDPDPFQDSVFAEAAECAGNVVWALTFAKADRAAREQFRVSAGDEYSRYAWKNAEAVVSWDILEGPTDELRVPSSSAGFVNVPPDPDGTVRRLPLFAAHAESEQVYPSFAVACVSRALGLPESGFRINEDAMSLPGGARIPLDDGSMVLAFPGQYRTVRYVSYYDVLQRRLPPDFYHGKIVLVGSSAAGLSDLVPVPFAPRYPGVEVQASAMVDLLDARAVHPPSPTVGYLLTVLLAVSVAAIAMRMRPVRAVVIGVSAVVVWAAVSFWVYLAFTQWIEVVRPVGGLVVALVGTVGYRVWREEREKRRFAGILSLYVAPSVVSTFLKEGLPEFGGERRECSVLFSDLAEFTTQAERVPAEVTVSYLNDYLTAMTDVVFQNGGTVDKFIGDAVMAIFGAPVRQEDNADAAVRCALEMLRAYDDPNALPRRAGIEQKGLKIGVATGEMLVGNFGSKTRFSYTAIGDPVNLGSRLEGLNKVYGTRLLISSATRRALGPEFVAREVDTVRVVGRREPETVYEVADVDPDGRTSLERAYAEALVHYRAAHWDEAESCFARCAEEFNDRVAITMLARVKILRAVPPENWDGVWNMESK